MDLQERVHPWPQGLRADSLEKVNQREREKLNESYKEEWSPGLRPWLVLLTKFGDKRNTNLRRKMNLTMINSGKKRGENPKQNLE